jgi:hypothetical protein
MKFPKKSLLAILGVLAIMLAVSAPTAQAKTETASTGAPVAILDMSQIAEDAGLAWDEEKQAFLDAWECSSGFVCFFSGSGGTGKRCAWSGADDNWLAGTVTCSWSEADSVESVRNNGTSTAFNGVRYYTRINYVTSVGCIPRGAKGTLNTSRLLRSHKWESGSCG